MSEHYLALKIGGGSRPVEVGLETLREGFQENETWTLPVLEKLVTKAIAVGIQTTPVRGDILMVDEELPSHSRPDVVWRDLVNGLTVTDTKVKMKLDAKWRWKTLEEFEIDWQLLHYAWEVGEVLGEPVQYVSPHIISLAPTVNGVVHPVKITPHLLSLWHRQAENAWWRMEHEIEAPPLPNLTSCLRGNPRPGGRCEFVDLCHTMEGNEDKAAILYDRKPPREFEHLSSEGEET
ncbi:MAG: hypothetical protein AABY22_05720 [Nanoarchaeota archaeon]